MDERRGVGPAGNGKQGGVSRPQGAEFSFRRWLVGRGRQGYELLVALRGLYRAGELPGFSKASILADWPRQKAGAEHGKGDDDVLRFLGRTFACRGRRAAGVAYREIFIKRDYEFVSANPTPRILDCGANIGLATLFFKLRYPESRIDAFEADPDLAALLARNVRENALAGVRVHACALAGAEGEIDFHRNAAFSLCGSLQASRGGGGEAVRVPACRLSEWIGDGVDFLKMDIEGAESEVVAELFEAGALERVREAVVEYHHNLEGRRASLAQFLAFWERVGFAYQVAAECDPGDGPCFQDILIRFWRAGDREGCGGDRWSA
ncbi:MAG: FkbM family methyltransferase [Methylacidiphilaceae bacterium]|nr:FkbM family methyltransferase [Candidatus Methylacidiphilaceae bacterium]